MNLTNPHQESIIKETDNYYICMASYPITLGHTIVVWKNHVEDIHSLNITEYLELMSAVEDARDALLKSLKIEKVYLIYADEVKHVHWHLIPRYDEKGFNMLNHKPKQTFDFSLASKIKSNLI